jgi:hypothetical protein
MAVDHLLGNETDDEDAGLVDPEAFAISAGVSVAASALLFGLVVPRARARGPERAATIGLACSVLSLLPGIGFLWLGLPFVLAGAGVALGLGGLRSSRRRRALAAVVVGAIVIALGTGLYAAAAVSKLL